MTTNFLGKSLFGLQAIAHLGGKARQELKAGAWRKGTESDTREEHRLLACFLYLAQLPFL